MYRFDKSYYPKFSQRNRRLGILRMYRFDKSYYPKFSQRNRRLGIFGMCRYQFFTHRVFRNGTLTI